MLAHDSRLFCRAAFNTKRKRKLTPRVHSALFLFLRLFTSFRLPTATLYRVYESAEWQSPFTRVRRVGALALIHLASPKEVINHPVRRILRLSSVSQYLTLVNQATAIRIPLLRRLMIDIASRRLDAAKSARARVITSEIFAYRRCTIESRAYFGWSYGIRME